MDAEGEVTLLVDEIGGRHIKDVDSMGEYDGCVDGL
jgi:hypothetical protein